MKQAGKTTRTRRNDTHEAKTKLLDLKKIRKSVCSVCVQITDEDVKPVSRDV